MQTALGSLLIVAFNESVLASPGIKVERIAPASCVGRVSRASKSLMACYLPREDNKRNKKRNPKARRDDFCSSHDCS
jgi:hypothetical protein